MTGFWVISPKAFGPGALSQADSAGASANPMAATEGAMSASAPAGQPMSTGLMGGMSTSAAGDVSALTINADSLAFSNADSEATFSAPTEYLGVVTPDTLIASGGDSFAAAAPSASATRVELRHITGAASESLCGGQTATHAAIVYMEPLTALQLMVFTGADAPGPNAHDSSVCAIFAYAVD